MQLAINHDAKRDQIEDHRGGDHSIPKTHSGQAFRAAMIFSDGLENDAPPKVAVDLDVPFVPAGINRIAPPFFFKQLENCAKQMVTVPAFVAPENSAAQTARWFRISRQMFVGANNATRCP